MSADPLQDVPVIDTARCSGCGRCVAACPERLISLEPHHYRKYALISRPEHCTRCGACLVACPLGAIHQTPFFP